MRGARTGRTARRSAAVGASITGGLIAALVSPATGHAAPPAAGFAALRPGMAIIPERVVGPEARVSCSVGFLVQDEQGRVYGTTVGHCYAGMSQHRTRTGFEDFSEDVDGTLSTGEIDPEMDEVHAALDCGTGDTDDPASAIRLCETREVYGKFVYAINNPFDKEVRRVDPRLAEAVDRGVDERAQQGTHNNEVGVGDFALFRLHPRVAYDPSMCLFGGPTELYTETGTRSVVVRGYGAGAALGYNVAAGGAIAPGWTGVAVLGPTPSPWTSDYTFTSTFSPDVGTSGGPVMTDDGKAVGLQGGIHYLDRLDTNLQRAGERLGLRFSLLTVDGSLRSDWVSKAMVDAACTPQKPEESGGAAGDA